MMMNSSSNENSSKAPFSNQSLLPLAPLSPTDEGFLSKSLGDAYRSSGGILPLHRQISEVSSITHSGYLFKRSNRPHQPVSPFPLDSLEITTTTPTATTTTNNNNDRGSSLQPKPMFLNEEALGFAGHYYSPTESNSTGYYEQHPNNNTKRRPLHLSLADPDTSLAAKFSSSNQTQQNNNNTGKQQRPSAAAAEDRLLPMTPFLKSSERTTESISTKGSDDDADATAAEAETTTRKRQSAVAAEQSLNSLAGFFGLTLEPAFYPPPPSSSSILVEQQQAVTPSPEAAASSSNNNASIFRESGSSDNNANANTTATQPTTKSTPIKMNIHEPFDHAVLHRNVSAPSFLDNNNNANNNNTTSNSATEEGTMHSPKNRSRPVDYVDPKDGHTWRAKYCVLEDGILYFYRNADDANHREAIQERKNGDLLSDNSVSNNHYGYGGAADLAKSPKPSRSLINLSGALLDGSLSGSNNSNSEGTSNFMWEKRVALNCVGAVRSAESEYGSNALELLAVQDDDEDGEADSLVLKAVTMTEMNEWLFQFHRSLASFVMNMVDLVGSSPSYALGDIHHPSFAQEGVIQTIQNSPVRSFNIPAFSPRFVKSMQGQPAAALSHGHGRSHHERRRKSGLKKTFSNGSVASSPSTTLSPAQRLFQSERTPSTFTSNLVTPLKHGGMSPPEPEVQIPYPQRTSELFDTSPELSAPQSANPPETERPPAPATGGKYVPPHMRKGGAKYVPPHLRNKDKTTDASSKPPPPQKYVPPHLRNSDDGLPPRPSSLAAERESLEASSAGPGQTIATPFQELAPKSPKVEGNSKVAFKLGGCADPVHIEGSILDQMYIERHASKVGRAQTDAFGSIGGGNLSATTSAVDVNSATSLKWELGAVSECGIRDTNEDAYLVTNDLVETFDSLIADAVSSTYWHQYPGEHQTGLFAIFDGHCGNEAARFAAEKLPQFLYDESLNHDSTQEFKPQGMEDILRRAIVKLDEEFCRLCSADERKWESGSTALVAMLANEHLVVANVGDCRGVFCRCVEDRGLYRPDFLKVGEWQELLSDIHSGERCYWRHVAEVHSPSREDEKKRIENAGGWTTVEKEIPVSQLQRMDFMDEDVVGILKRCFFDRFKNSEDGTACNSRSAPQRIIHISRVCGELAVSRAIGDCDFKAPAAGDGGAWDCPVYLPFPEGHSGQFVGDVVSGQPDFHAFQVGEADVNGEFLLLACDGLWDVMDMDDAVRVTRDLLFAKKCSAKKAAARLAELAIHLGSSDNITVIVIRFFPKNTTNKAQQPETSTPLETAP